MELKINFPIVKSWKSENYALILEDSKKITHYFNFDGSYDGWSGDPEIDLETQQNLN